MNHSKITTKISECDDNCFDDSSYFENFVDSTFTDTRRNGNPANTSLDKSSLNVSALCCDEELNGYDKLTGQNWIYPTNYPVRDYQFNIIKAALLKNTLVSLPTGLGKTFIAAVVIYNFYRWYPLGKIIFTAPTRPLVAQQIEACYNIVAIPPRDTIEMTGHMQTNTRKAYWKTKRVFFATPQVIYNDIKSGICPGDKLRCLVIDEAHRARGNYAYCQIISTLTDIGHKTYRVLALSATPGSKVEDVINVVNSLHVAHLELRAEDCIDVSKYVHSRKINTEVIQLGPELTQLRNQYVEILDVYARRLKQFNILPQHLGNLSKGRIVMLYKEYQNKDRRNRHPQHNHIMKDFTVLIALYHGLELLVKHGSRVFLNFFDEHPEKSWIQSDDRLTSLLERTRDDLGVNPLSFDRSVLPDGTIPEIPKNLSFGHPKFDRLKEIMLNHFTVAKSKGEDTRAIVFCEYRESVNLVHCLLLQCRPLIVPQMFVGQGVAGREGGTTQRAQGRAIAAFRAGTVNVLVSTCVAEEGLDVGAVDLCVCFDVSTRSPIRLVQRCGRTGRARGGQIYILVTEGREHQTLLESMRQRDSLNSKVLQSKEVQNNLYKSNPRMIPRDFTPECKKMYITVKDNKETDAKDETNKTKKGQRTLKNMLQRKSSTRSSTKPHTDAESVIISKDDFNVVYPEGYRDDDKLPIGREYWCTRRGNIKSHIDVYEKELKISSWPRTPGPAVQVGPSHDTDMLQSLLQYCDTKRNEIAPPTQDPIACTTQPLPYQTCSTASVKVKPAPKRKTKMPSMKSPSKKDGDIRALFSTATKSTQNYTKQLNDLGIQNGGSLSTRLISLLVDLSLEHTNVARRCYICSYICDCKIVQNIRNVKKSCRLLLPADKQPGLPDLNLIDDFDADLIRKCNESDGDAGESGEKECHVDALEEEDINISSNFDLRFDLEDPVCDLSKPVDVKVEKENLNSNFDIGDIDDIFDQSSPEENSSQCIENVPANTSKPKETLNFFGLNSIDDIFADSEDDHSREAIETDVNDIMSSCNKTAVNPRNRDNNPTDNTIDSTDSNPGSPSILSGRLCSNTRASPTSPILCSQVRKFQLSTKKKHNDNSTVVNSSIPAKRSLNFDKNRSHSLPSPAKTPLLTNRMWDNNKSLTLIELVQMIDENTRSSLSKTTNPSIEGRYSQPTSERSHSPTILTQRDKIILTNAKESQNKTPSNVVSNLTTQKVSLVILDSDSDSQQEYEVDDLNLRNVDKIEQNKAKENLTLTNTLSIFDEKSKEKSMLTITQIINMVAGQNENSASNVQKYPEQKQSGDESEGSTSPIILTQRDKTKLSDSVQMDKFKVNIKREAPNKTLTVLDSDSDSSSDFQLNDKHFENGESSQRDRVTRERNKRKLDDDDISASPYFNKKPKVSNFSSGPLSLQKKVLAALSSNRAQTENVDSNDKRINFLTHVTKDTFFPQKENQEPLSTMIKEPDLINTSHLFERNNKTPYKMNTNGTSRMPMKRKVFLDSSDDDDDFIDNHKCYRSPGTSQTDRKDAKRTTNYKVRKKNKMAAQFIEEEAELSENGSRGSGDELSDDSVGSIVDFICDSPANTQDAVDMHAYYIKSVKSPIKGVFKIPQLPTMLTKADVLSQAVEDDTYELDSFCVDSHVGLTQVHEISELDEAERILEEKRKRRRRAQKTSASVDESGDSPVIKRRFKTVKRAIESDSEDSEKESEVY